ncbi:MAG: DUF3379 family protein [Gammaproteobacteria bacterium]|nr:MAG: DUF3379 family protein [Gammaproteobacteria bacterium]
MPCWERTSRRPHMKCLEFRRELLQDPFAASETLLAHEAECEECARFSRRTRAREAALRNLLRAPEPPPELAERVRLAIRMEQQAERRRPFWLAAAASVMLAVTLGLVSLYERHIERGHMALAQSVVYHIVDEAKHLHTPGPAAPQRVREVFARFGAQLAGDIGQINFAAECLMRNRTGIHLVLQGEQGPVTVFLMPGETPARTVPVETDRFEGEILPTPWGSIAVVGERGEPVEPLAVKVVSRVRWGARPATGVAGLAQTGGQKLAGRISL